MKKNMTTALVILSIMGLSIIAGCAGPSENPVSSNPMNPLSSSSDWCKPGKTTTKSTYGSSSNEVKGITDFRGHTVCEVVSTTNEYTISMYYTKDSTYTYQIMKDKDGNIVNEGETTTSQ